MDYEGFYQTPEGKSEGRATGYYIDELPMSVRATTEIPKPSYESGANPQGKAEDLQKEHAHEPFHLVLDLDAWRDYLAPYQVVLQREREKQLAADADDMQQLMEILKSRNQ